MDRKTWEISDEFWIRVETLIPESSRDEGREYKRKPGAGRKPINQRLVLGAILHVLKTSIPWKSLPKEQFGSPSCIHAYFKKWEASGFFKRLWESGLAESEEMKGIAWEWDAGNITSAGANDTRAPEISSPLRATKENSKPANGWRPIISRRNREKDSGRRSFTLVEGQARIQAPAEPQMQVI